VHGQRGLTDTANARAGEPRVADPWMPDKPAMGSPGTRPPCLHTRGVLEKVQLVLLGQDVGPPLLLGVVPPHLRTYKR
jgi:hypothetical protein